MLPLSRLTPNDQRILCVLARSLPAPEGRQWATLGRLVAETGMPKTTVIGRLERLIRRGFIVHPGRGCGYMARYPLAIIRSDGQERIGVMTWRA